MSYTSTYRDSTGRTARPGSTIGRTTGYVVHTEAGAAMPASATLAQERARIRAIDAFHRSLGWGGFGYSAAVAASGRVHEGRGWFRSGAHTVGWNSSRHAIVQLGHGDREPLTERAIAGIIQWHLDGHRAGALTDRPAITGHRDHLNPVTKSCPGSRVYPQLPRLRWWATSTDRPAIPVTPTPSPAPSGDLLEEIANMTPADRKKFAGEIADAVWAKVLTDPYDGKQKQASTVLRYGGAAARRLADAWEIHKDMSVIRRLRLSVRALGHQTDARVAVNGKPDGRDVIV